MGGLTESFGAPQGWKIPAKGSSNLPESLGKKEDTHFIQQNAKNKLLKMATRLLSPLDY